VKYENVFEKAKQNVDLPTILRAYGFELRKFNGSLRSNRCPACGPSRHKNSTRLSIRYVDGTWMWHCFACGEGGDVVRAVQFLEGFYSAKDAAEWILDGEIKPTFHPQPAYEIRAGSVSDPEVSKVNRARLEVISRLIGVATGSKGSRKRIWEYLIEERKIPEAVVREAIRRRLIHTLPDSPPVANRVILESVPPELLSQAELLTKSRKVRGLILMRPILSPFRKKKEGIVGAEFRAISDDVQPKAISLASSYLWWWNGEDKSVCVVEGMIDLLSLVAMGWKGSIVGLAGVGLARKAADVLKGPLKGRDIYIALDADQAGTEAAEKILCSVPVKAVLTLPDGKDINDLLREGVRDWRQIKTRKEAHYEQGNTHRKAWQGCGP